MKLGWLLGASAMNAGSAAVSTGKFGRAVMRLGGMCHRAPVVELLAWLERLHAQPLIREGADIGFVKIVRDMTEVHEAQPPRAGSRASGVA